MIFRHLALTVQRTFAGFDKTASHQPPLPAPLQPVFLIGAPRTGSTLLFQALAQQLKIAYVSNLMALLPRLMVRLCRVYPHIASNYKAPLLPGEFGYVRGLLAPNEAGGIMRHWFDTELGPDHDRKVSDTVAAITNAVDAPLFIKNQANTLRSEHLLRIFPGARFIHLRRSPLYTAQSLILVRRRLFGDDRHWWSVAPPGYESVLAEDPFYQVLWQNMKLDTIAAEICSHCPEHCCRIDYETFCEDPQAALDSLRKRLHLEGREEAPRLPGMQRSESRRLSPSDWERLVQIHETHFAGADTSTMLNTQADTPLRET